MNVLCFTTGPLATNAYLVVCLKTKVAVLIDAPPDCYQEISRPIVENHWELQGIWLTHSHWDHMAALKEWKQYAQVPVFVHPLDAENIRNPGSDGVPCFVDLTPVEPDREFEEGSSLLVGKHSFTVLHTPGHTLGGVCFWCEKEKILFSGDTLFKGAFGKVSFPSSSPEMMKKSLQRLSSLPEETVVYPGHGPTTTIGQEPQLDNLRRK